MNQELQLIKDKIKFIEEQLEFLKKRVSLFEKNNSFKSNSNENFTTVSNKPLNYNNKDEYLWYFVHVKKGLEKTALRHFNQLHDWKIRLCKDMKLEIKDEVYYIDDYDYFNKLVELFEANGEMLDKNTNKVHYYYSAAYNSFNNFLKWKQTNNNSNTEEDVTLESTNCDKAPKEQENINVLEKMYGKIQKVEKNVYQSTDGKNGFIIINSKTYYSGKKNLPAYWYAFRERKFLPIESCANKYLILGYGNPIEMFIFTYKNIMELKEKLKCTYNNDGSISHYHISLFKEEDGIITMRLSKPKVVRININKYKLANK